MAWRSAPSAGVATEGGERSHFLGDEALWLSRHLPGVHEVPASVSPSKDEQLHRQLRFKLSLPDGFKDIKGQRHVAARRDSPAVGRGAGGGGGHAGTCGAVPVPEPRLSLPADQRGLAGGATAAPGLLGGRPRHRQRHFQRAGHRGPDPHQRAGPGTAGPVLVPRHPLSPMPGRPLWLQPPARLSSPPR